MNRRELLLGGVVIAATRAVASRSASAQQLARVYRIGFLSTSSGTRPGQEKFEATLADLGYQEGRNLVIERRYAGGDLTRLPDLAADLVGADVDVIVTVTTPAALAAKQATARIPIIITNAGDAVGAGLVASLARPGGNVTGLSILTVELEPKRLELLRELKADARRVAYFGNSQNAADQLSFRQVQTAATSVGMDAIFVNAPVPEACESAFASMAAVRVDVLIVSPAATDLRSQIVATAARYRLPTAYGTREFVDAGGLISYGTSRADVFRRGAMLVEKILKGAKPADLPVEQPTKFELVVNLNTARALDLTVPGSLLARAAEVIE